MINTPQAPYYDDFDVEKNFLKILFKPKLSVQTRELEQIQSMFQNQIETLASQIFQNGSVISGGKFSFKEQVNYVKLYNEYNSQTFNYNIYKDRYVYGTTTKILARVFNGWSQSSNEVASLYLDYLTSGEQQQQTFQPGEVLQLVSVVYLNKISGDIGIGDKIRGLGIDGSTGGGAEATIVNINNNEYEVIYSTSNTLLPGEQVLVDHQSTTSYYLCTSSESVIYKTQVKATTDDSESVGFGSAVYVDEGIYYIDGYFVYTGNQSKIISNYSTNTNARVGFEKEVQIITSNEDPSLLDNANGYPNYNAPGADRLKINLVLDYYNLYETPSENFVEVLTIEDSTVTGNSSVNQKYSEILDTMARRTYDESGNYTVNPFLIDIREFLDDGTNNGVYKPEHFGYKSESEALNTSVKVFGLMAPGAFHIFGTKYYPCLNHDEYLEACKNRLAVGVEPGKAYVMGYEIDHTSKQWFPLLKARDTKLLNNSATNIFYGNYIKVNNISGLPDIYKHQTVYLSSSETYPVEYNPIEHDPAEYNIVGSAKIYAIEVDSGNPGDSECIYRLYIDTINMYSGDFSTTVNSLGNAQIFSAKCIKSNGQIVINNLQNSALIFPFEKSMISNISDASYDYRKVFTETITTGPGDLGTFTIPTDSTSRFVNINDNRNYLLTILNGELQGQIIDTSSLGKSLDSSGNLTFSGLDARTIGRDCVIIATLHNTTDTIKTKTLYSNVEYVFTPTGAQDEYKEIKLNHADGYRLIGVYDSEDPSVAPTTSSKNITDSYTFDDGQRDTYYDLARIKLKDGVIEPTGQILVVYDYFSHSTGDYFTVDSYVGIDYEDIPTYSNENGIYELKNCLDIRGRVDENGSGNFNTSSLPHILPSNSIFESDLSYYLPRLDLLELDYKGDFNIKYGTSSEDPQYPIGSINSMTLYYLAMPSYTERPEDVVRIYCENKRYTMRDIGNLDNRITAIEDYIMLNGQESDTNNLQIYDAKGYQCIKTGFIVDVFINDNFSDEYAVGYRCSMDSDSGILRPSYKLHTVNLEKSTNRQSTVIEENGVYMIPYTPKEYISNSVNTGYISVNTNKLVEWEGNVVLNRTLLTKYNEADATPINYGSPQPTSFVERLNLKLKRRNNRWGLHSRSWFGSSTIF